MVDDDGLSDNGGGRRSNSDAGQKRGLEADDARSGSGRSHGQNGANNSLKFLLKKFF